MTPKTATIEIPELMQFLRQQLHDLPDKRKPGNNTKYRVEDAVMAAFSIFGVADFGYDRERCDSYRNSYGSFRYR